VPVLTLPGSHLFGRFTLGLYQEMQIADAIVSDVEQYADRAVRLAKDREYRQSVASLIAARSDVLFERRDMADALAACIESEAARVS
jgi:predicted O-linked N-acetylglucosamine transferase (SPINDLY family)